MNKPTTIRSDPSSRAFTRIELLATCAILLLLALVLAPAAISQRSDANRQVCFNNLRLIGRGVMTWAADHTQQLPWRTPQADGGTLQATLRPGNAWYEFVALSNELVWPKVLVCPADVGVRQIYGTSEPWNYFTQPQFRQNSVSYSLSVDGSMDLPQSWLSSDRNTRTDGVASGCSALVNNIYRILANTNATQVAWTNSVVHGVSGHVLTTDGSVEFTSSTRLKQMLLGPGLSDNGQIHFLNAR